MTYEEACKELDACCGDWRLKKAAFDLEKINAAILDLMDGSRIPKAGPRYYSVGTWFANNDRYREIATTLDFPEARGMCYD